MNNCVQFLGYRSHIYDLRTINPLSRQFITPYYLPKLLYFKQKCIVIEKKCIHSSL